MKYSSQEHGQKRKDPKSEAKAATKVSQLLHATVRKDQLHLSYCVSASDSSSSLTMVMVLVHQTEIVSS